MKTIILGFSRPKKLFLFAKAIMWADSIPYDHVYVKWSWDKIERDIIYQAAAEVPVTKDILGKDFAIPTTVDPDLAGGTPLL